MGEAGLSKLIGLKSAVLFSAFLLTRNSSLFPFTVPLLLLYASLISLLVSLAAHPSINLPLLLGKRGDGSFPLWSAALFLPYLAFIRLFVLLRRLRSGEPAYTRVSDGLYVGAWPSSARHLPPGDPAVLDCTCELPRTAAAAKNSYLCIATWDTRAPLPGDIAAAIRWASRQIGLGKPVLVHCAFGHGRSVCVMCALLVALGRADDWKAAEKMIAEKRPFIRMNGLQRRRLEQWSTPLASPR